MRLGDLDALYEEVADHVTSVSVCTTVQQAIGQTDFKRRCLEDIHSAPTIDAIPVEWIKNRLNAMLKGTTSAESCFAVQIMLVDWQKEQEASE